MDILGISTTADAMSACLLRNGALVAAAEEQRMPAERGARQRVTAQPLPWPQRAIAFCLARAGLTEGQLDHIAIVGPRAPYEPASAATGTPYPLQQRAGPDAERAHPMRHLIDRWCALEAAASLAVPFERCAVMVLDGMQGTGRGEPAVCYGRQDGRRYRRLGEACAEYGVAHLQAEVSMHLGFSSAPADGRLAALAACGRPGFVRVFRDALQYTDRGRFWAAPADWRELLGPPRLPGQALEQRHIDIAHSFQRVLEDTVLEMAQWLYRASDESKLCVAGRLTANTLLNTALRARSPFSEVAVAPVQGDTSSAVGAALLVDAAYGVPASERWVWTHPFLGPAWSADEIERVLVDSKLAYRQCADVASDCAALLAQDKIVGWFSGAAEFGMRSLGARSILAAPFDRAMQERIESLKGREDVHRPAAVVSEEHVADWFQAGRPSPFMSFVDHIKPAFADQLRGVCHIDGSVRLQTVARTQHRALHEVLGAFRKACGVPILISSGFCRSGEETVQTPEQALALFCSSALDALAIGPFLLEKSWLTAWRGRAP